MEAGAPGRTRTCDLPLRRRLLYPLSYRGVAAQYSEGGGWAEPAQGNPQTEWPSAGLELPPRVCSGKAPSARCMGTARMPGGAPAWGRTATARRGRLVTFHFIGSVPMGQPVLSADGRGRRAPEAKKLAAERHRISASVRAGRQAYWNALHNWGRPLWCLPGMNHWRACFTGACFRSRRGQDPSQPNRERGPLVSPE